ncbi:MAG: MaoC family dehydratase [Bacteroidota bacterium]|nr:MaoC family dehydratase [Chitinophagaceae bacterium]QLH44357.1 MAG: MaoC family dehydratase [Bacteroidota bacterium]
MLNVGDKFEHEYSYTQEEVNLYAQVSGDTNPLHVNEDAGKSSIFGRCIMHGFLGASVFTKIFGALWYADGHIYMKQSMMWMKPMFVDTKYKAVITVKEIFPDKNRVLYDCAVFDSSTGDQTISGEALLMNKKQYVWS